MATQIAGGAEYDIVYMATEGQRLFASRDVLLPLDDYIAQDQEAIDDYFADTDPNLRELTLKYGSPDGQTYFIPGGYNTVVMYCNTEVFEAAGVELADDWTWDEFFEAGVAIKEANGGFLHPMGSGFTFGQRHAVAAHQRGEHARRGVGDGDVQHPRGRGGRRVRQALHRRGAVARARRGVRRPRPAHRRQPRRRSAGGGGSPATSAGSSSSSKIRIVNWPTNTGNGTPMGWDGWPIMKTSSNPTRRGRSCAG